MRLRQATASSEWSLWVVIAVFTLTLRAFPWHHLMARLLCYVSIHKTKGHRLDSLTSLFSTVLEAGNHREGRHQGPCLLRALCWVADQHLVAVFYTDERPSPSTFLITASVPITDVPLSWRSSNLGESINLERYRESVHSMVYAEVVFVPVVCI